MIEFITEEIVEKPKPKPVLGTTRVDIDGDLRSELNGSCYAYIDKDSGKLRLLHCFDNQKAPGIAYDSDGYIMVERH